MPLTAKGFIHFTRLFFLPIIFVLTSLLLFLQLVHNVSYSTRSYHAKDPPPEAPVMPTPWDCPNASIIAHSGDRSFILAPRPIPDSNTTFLIYVHSTPRKFLNRELIRRTWGAKQFYRRHFLSEDNMPFFIHVIFVMGLQPSQMAMRESLELLFEESCLHGDILLGDFEDTYYNLTQKALTAMAWVTQTLPRVKYILKVDDDVMLNTFAFIQRALWMENEGACPSCVLCRPWFEPPVRRSGKWQVSEDQYPRERYPTFCSGSAYLTTQSVIRQLLEASKTVPHYFLDDVYLTGILAETLTIPRFDLGGDKFWLFPQDYSQRQLRPDNFYVAHDFDLNNWEDFWHQVLDVYTVTQ